MSNMPYCRFSNTLLDLRDCYDNLDDKDLDSYEEKARTELIELCHEIASITEIEE